MTLSSLPTRNLDRRELEGLVDKLALDIERWRELVDFSDKKRVFVSLHRDDFVDVWLLCWTRYELEVAKRKVDEAQALESMLEGSR